MAQMSQMGDVCIVQIATGKEHVLALDSKGRVYSWGRNDHGQLGHGEFERVDLKDYYENGKSKESYQIQLVVETPRIVRGAIDGSPICQIYAGQY